MLPTKPVDVLRLVVQRIAIYVVALPRLSALFARLNVGVQSPRALATGLSSGIITFPRRMLFAALPVRLFGAKRSAARLAAKSPG
jgi:hypothetical protein